MQSFLSLLLFLSLSTTHLIAQSNCDCYERLNALSDYYTSIEEHELALETFEKALANKEKDLWNKFDLVKLAWRHVDLENFEKAKEQFANGLRMGSDFEYIEGSEKAEEFKKSAEWKELVELLPQLKREYQANLNLEYRLAIEEISGMDQAIRTFLFKDFPDSLWMKVDTTSLSKVKTLIEKHGYPHPTNHRMIGWDVYHIFMHASMYSEEVFEDILAILKQAQGECLDTKKNIALLIDRREVWKNEAPQIYGLWNSLKREGKYAPFHNLEEVDALRLEYNLLRLEEQSKIKKLELPEGYKTIPYPDNYFCGYDFED